MVKVSQSVRPSRTQVPQYLLAAISSRERCDDVHQVQIADGRRYGLEGI
jgi:hypothetical protein